jgi:signal transduction histidine kinase
LKIAGEKLEKEAADLARANEELKKIDQMKSEFTSMVSHELRTPLAAIKEGIAIVLDGTAGNINEKQKEFLELGKRNVDRLSRLINNILDFQKLESAKVLLNIVDNDINEAVLEVEATMKPLAKEKELVLVSETEKGLPKIKFDRDKIIQVLTNLANNAIKFTQKGTITIKTERAKEVVKISVIDTGSGIKEEDLSKLFQPFVQLEKGPDKTSGGTGLGLAICREIINRHKGKIWAESKPGKGSVFVFVLPVVERRS